MGRARKVKPVTNVNLPVNRIKKKLVEKINTKPLPKPIEVLDDNINGPVIDSENYTVETIYDEVKTKRKEKLNQIDTKTKDLEDINDLGSLYTVKENDQRYILENINTEPKVTKEDIKNEVVNGRVNRNRVNDLGDISTNTISNRQSKIDQLILDNSQIFTPNTGMNQNL